MIQEMSDVCAYECVDGACNEFCWSDDHIVPDNGSKGLDDCFILGDSHEKPRCELTNISSTTGDTPAARYINQGKELSEFSTLDKLKITMLEKDSLSQKRKFAFISASDSDPTKEALSLASDSTMLSTHGLSSCDVDSNGGEFCGNDAIFSDETNMVGDNSFSYQLGEINQTSSDLTFLENSENKDSNDFLYYGWPEIGNFEDIDGMLRSCNSTFDLGFPKGAELGWSSSPDDLGTSGDALKLDVNFPCPEPDVVNNISEKNDTSNGYSLDDSGTTSSSTRYKGSSWTSEKSDSCMSFAIGPATTEMKHGFIPQEKINQRKQQIKLQNQPEGKSNSGNGNLNHIRDLHNEVSQLPSGLTSHRIFPSVCMQQKQHTISPYSYNNLQNPISYLHSDNRNTHLSDPATGNLEPSTFKSETTDLTSVSLRESSNASIQFLESSLDPHIEMPALPVYEHREKKLHIHEGNCKNQKDPEGFSVAKFGSSNVQKSSTESSGFDDISLEAGFRQLQLVMEQLDMRMKLCIRDSLYRLAWSARQRQRHANLNAGSGNGSDAFGGASMAEETNSFIDMETNTNPIDRSIAHLLFCRPSHSPAAPTHDSFPFKPPSVVKVSDASPPLFVENLVSKEIASEAGKN